MSVKPTPATNSTMPRSHQRAWLGAQHMAEPLLRLVARPLQIGAHLCPGPPWRQELLTLTVRYLCFLPGHRPAACSHRTDVSAMPWLHLHGIDSPRCTAMCKHPVGMQKAHLRLRTNVCTAARHERQLRPVTLARHGLCRSQRHHRGATEAPHEGGAEVAPQNGTTIVGSAQQARWVKSPHAGTLCQVDTMGSMPPQRHGC